MLFPPLQSRSWKETKFPVGWEEQKTGAGMVQGTPLSALRGPPSRDEQKPGYLTPYPSVGLGGASSCPLREDRRPPGQATRGGATGPLGSRKESETSHPDFRFRRLHAPSRWPPRSPVAPGSGRRAPQTWSPEHCVPDGRRPMAEGRREGPRQQATHGGGRGSPAPPRLAGGADRERALRRAALGGRGQDPLPHPLEARSQAGLPGAAGRGALQGKGAGAGGRRPGPGGLCAHTVAESGTDPTRCNLGPQVQPLTSVVSRLRVVFSIHGRPSHTLLKENQTRAA